MEFKIGEITRIKDVDFLVLDICEDGSPFLLALGLDTQAQFSSIDNNYITSDLKTLTDNWIDELNIPTIPRSLDLLTMDGDTVYGKMIVNAAPLTFDEWRRYASVIRPYIKKSFWLVTAWTNADRSNAMCFVDTDGCGYDHYYITYGFAPALILDVKEFSFTPTPTSIPISTFSTEELIKELIHRIGDKGRV